MKLVGMRDAPFALSLLLVAILSPQNVSGQAEKSFVFERHPCDESDQEPALLATASPAYPEIAGKYCIEGYVKFDGVINPDGSVSVVEIIESQPPHIFDETVRYVEGLRFKPACRDGEPVIHGFTQEIDFKIHEDHEHRCPANLEGEARGMYSHVMAIVTTTLLALMEKEDPYQHLDKVPVGEPRFSGDLGRLEQFYIRSLNRWISLHNNMHERMHQIGWNDFQDARRLEADIDFFESRQLLLAMHELDNQVWSVIQELLEQERIEAQNLDVSPDNRDLFLSGYSKDEVHERKMKEWLRVLEANRKVLEEHEKIIDLLQETRGGWFVEDSEIRFSEQRDSDRFHARIRAMADMNLQRNLVEIELLDRFWAAFQQDQ